MNVMVIGSGGREHCLTWALRKSPRVDRLICAPGNAGMAAMADCVDLACAPPFDAIIDFARANDVGMVVVGPEAPLVDGVADTLTAAGLRVFGPGARAARMEGSKAFAKEVMNTAGVPTGRAVHCDDLEAARRALAEAPFPTVLKYDALAAGKGVTIHRDRDDAHAQLSRIFEENVFGGERPSVLIEEFLEGPEASVLALVDGKTIAPMIAAQDHKPIGEGDTGLNTGGMGAYAPTPLVTPELSGEIMDRVLRPTVAELARRDIVYKGVLYAGLILTRDGPRVLEYNCRFGDPETQVVLPLLENDLLEVCEAVVDERLDQIELAWRPGYAMTVVGAAGGYPSAYEKGYVVEGLDAFEPSETRLLFHAGTTLKDGRVVTSGGRVLNAVALDADLRAARAACHEILEQVNFEGMRYRRDIGYRALD